MPITISSQQLVDQAMKEVTTYTAVQVKERLAVGDRSLQVVDIRDIRELEHGGTVVASLHMPRGMLEFWVDPSSKYFKPIFGDEGKEFVFFCGAGWRSALTTKTLQDMGMKNVAHIEGGYEAMLAAGLPMETLQERRAKKAS